MRILFLPIFIFAYNLNLATLLTKPKSYVRDFYLTQFMKETNSSTLAFKAYTSLYRVRVFKHLRILSRFKEFKDIYRCVNVKKEYLREVDISCILNNGLSLKTISRLNKKDLIYLYLHLPDGKVKRAVRIFLLNDFSKIFKDRKLGYYFILSYPNKKIDQFIDDFNIFKGKEFYLFIKSAVTHRLSKIQVSLNSIDFVNIGDKAKWWLFLNAMLLNDEKRALNILKSIKKRDDKIYFWLYKLSGNKVYFNKLLKNPRVSFYRLYVREEVNKKFEIKTKIIYNSIKNSPYNQENPWSVLKFFDDLKRVNPFKLAKLTDNNSTMALKALALDKAFHYRKNFFITPPIYEDKNITFKAFVYAITRQESRFIPASVSSSYALGAMQIMPFLVKELKGDIFNQFDYKENITLGVKHLKWLFSKLKDPLMVAYAYNGGIGFVKRRVKSYFKYKGKYEPFLSIELVPYDESREYGKKVITNFVIYSHIFGDKKLTLHKLLKK